MNAKIEKSIRDAIKAAEKSPVAAVNKLWGLLGDLPTIIEAAHGDLEKRAEQAETRVRELLQTNRELEDAHGALVTELEEAHDQLEATPPPDLASAVRGYMRAVDRKSEKSVARCREQIEAILGPDPKAASGNNPETIPVPQTR